MNIRHKAKNPFFSFFSTFFQEKDRGELTNDLKSGRIAGVLSAQFM